MVPSAWVMTAFQPSATQLWRLALGTAPVAFAVEMEVLAAADYTAAGSAWLKATLSAMRSMVSFVSL